MFGPFVTVLTFKNDDEALAIANGTDYGLGSGLWTANLQRAHRFARELHAGMVWINSYKRVNPGSPFGGVGQSGYGREMGFDAMREYTQVKSVWVNVDAQIPPSRIRPTVSTDARLQSTSPSLAARRLRRRLAAAAGARDRALGARRALVLSHARAGAIRPQRVAELLGARAAGIFDRAVMHVPIETRARRAKRRGGSAPTAPSRSAAARPPAWARRSRSTPGCRSSPIPDHLRGQRDDADLRPHRRRPQEDRHATRACCRAP